VPIPIGWSFEDAALLGVTVGVAPLTALQCLHESLELPSPFEARSIIMPLVACRSIQKDPRYRKRQGYPGFHTTQWNCWSEGRSVVHAGWKGKSDAFNRRSIG
jgi:hypothetical protein